MSTVYKWGRYTAASRVVTTTSYALGDIGNRFVYGTPSGSETMYLTFDTATGTLINPTTSPSGQTVYTYSGGNYDVKVYRTDGSGYSAKIVQTTTNKTEYYRGSLIDTVTSTNRNAYPNNGKSGSYWYVYDGIQNLPPQISGEDLDLGSKMQNFVIPYTVTDAEGNAVTVTIKVDGVTKVSGQSVVLGRSYDYPVSLSEFSLGQHSVVITASDGTATATRTYTFTKSNNAPVISGIDEDLGGKSVAFTLNYTITDENGDDVTASVILDGVEIQNVTGAQSQSLSVTINNEQLAAMSVNSTHTITIKADDAKGGIAYRRYTFTRVNRAPVISGSDTDLGEVNESPSVEYSATDIEQDEITVSIMLNGALVQEATAVVDNDPYTYTVPHDLWIKLPYGQHTIAIHAWDAQNTANPTVRTYTFTRVAGGLEVIVKINEFDVQPAKIIAVPHGVFADDATVQVLVCNNFLDSEPTWEDASEMSRIARAYAFTNTTKTAEKWSIGIKIIVTNGASGISSVLRGIKGGYE